MKRINALLLLISVVIIEMQFSSCYNKQIKTGENAGIKGRFFNATFLEKFINSTPRNIPFYCTEMYFFKPDSVEISNGFEAYKLAYKKEGDHFLLIEASFKGNMPFRLNNDSMITLIDTAWTNIPSNSEFKKIPENKEAISSFDNYINEEVIAGEYSLYQPRNPDQHKVIFTTSGNVKGFGDYSSYSICYSGDCADETEPSSKTIEFTDKDGHFVVYTLIIDKDAGIVKLYNLSEPLKDMKGGLTILDMAYELRK
jgi:hypothetical protein